MLGVDPGTQNAGWGVVDRVGPRLVGVAAGVIKLPRDRPLAERLRKLHEALELIIDAHAPDALAVEDIFHGRYARAALQLGHARGVVLLAGAQSDLPISSYPPAVVKRAVGGRGQAAKRQVARLVGAILGLRKLPPADATDALAIAITHCRS